MKLMTKTLERRFAKIGSQEHKKDPIILAKFFNPTGAGTWYATEYDPQNRTFFGYVSIFGDWNDEWGYFSLDELQSYKGKFSRSRIRLTKGPTSEKVMLDDKTETEEGQHNDT